MGFSNVGLGIVHAMAHPLGAVYDTPHGVANAILLPTILEFNAPSTGEKYRDVAKVRAHAQARMLARPPARPAQRVHACIVQHAT